VSEQHAGGLLEQRLQALHLELALLPLFRGFGEGEPAFLNSGAHAAAPVGGSVGRVGEQLPAHAFHLPGQAGDQGLEVAQLVLDLGQPPRELLIGSKGDHAAALSTGARRTGRPTSTRSWGSPYSEGWCSRSCTADCASGARTCRTPAGATHPRDLEPKQRLYDHHPTRKDKSRDGRRVPLALAQ
jgi:hypothetical protein